MDCNKCKYEPHCNAPFTIHNKCPDLGNFMDDHVADEIDEYEALSQGADREMIGDDVNYGIRDIGAK
jgi:hypothetical protein